VPARVRVKIKSDDDLPIVPRIPSKQALLEEIAKIIPTMESRKVRLTQYAMMKQEQMRRMAAAAGHGHAGAGGSPLAPSKEDKKAQKKVEKKAAKKAAGR
jgi:hypothetical protein